MRIMNWNIKHMNSWWEGGNQRPAVLRQSRRGSGFAPGIADVPALAARAAQVVRDVDPDIIAIQEGPGLPEMEQFLGDMVGGPWEILRGPGGAQALLVAARTDRGVSDLADGETTVGAVVLDGPFTADTDADLVLEEVDFARVPQVVTFRHGGEAFWLINNHLKSKFVNGGRDLYEAGGQERLDYFAKALIARRRISAEAFRLRLFMDEILTADPGARIIVCGDLNDGPGADFFERNFLTHSVVDRVFGSVFHRDKQLTHVLLHGDSRDYTAKFFDFVAREERELVIDHIGLSRGVTSRFEWRGRVAVDEFEAQVLPPTDGLLSRDLEPSDHRPVVVDLTERCGGS